MKLPTLPVDAILPDIVASLKRNRNLVIEAPPGTGKTTRVPPAILKSAHEWSAAREVLVLEPRRIAARLAARRVASELGEKLGETVGYQVRFEEVSGAGTRLKFVTEGILTRRLLSDSQLVGVSTVVLDEFHERHLEGDLALALLKRLQTSRPDLRLVMMSATLEAASVARYLDDCPIIRVEGARFPLEIEHVPYSPAPMEVQVTQAVERLLSRGNTGDILVFLPGAAEIRRAMREVDAVARKANLVVLPLHGSLSPAEQDAAVAPASRQKLILSTNVAESSVTIEGVTAVIDSGLVRTASYSHWTGLPTLHVRRTSKASAIQRAGRAARTAPGRAIRLYSEEDFLHRADHDFPEILRADLSQLCLDLRAMGIAEPKEIDWLDAPPQEAVAHAEALLDRLGASGEMAQQLARFPLPPRISRILVEAQKHRVGHEGCIAAALLSSGEQLAATDLLHAMDLPRSRRLEQHIEQLVRIARPKRQTHRNDDAVLISVLAGFPDRVARLRSGKQVLLSTGASAEIAGERPPYEFMAALDAEERSDKPQPIIRLTSRIEPEWLIDLFPERVRETTRVSWNRPNERVESSSLLMYDELAIQESTGAATDDEAVSDLLAQKALEAGLERFVDTCVIEATTARLEFAGAPQIDAARGLRQLCRGIKSFAELKKAAPKLSSVLEQMAGVPRLEQLAPARIRLPNGRQTTVHYERGKPPWIASRLQDFFGMKETPRIGPAKTPVVVHLLAPNQRPVQTTMDLAGFWDRLYPQVRRELMRRYPRHAWPERPEAKITS